MVAQISIRDVVLFSKLAGYVTACKMETEPSSDAEPGRKGERLEIGQREISCRRPASD
jgi:hypothetical protein